MTSYILREPAYHKSAKLSAKLARIDNLGYASDLRLQGTIEQTYNQATMSTATAETQTEPSIPTQATTTESTVGMKQPAPIDTSMPFISAPSVVRDRWAPSSITPTSTHSTPTGRQTRPYFGQLQGALQTLRPRTEEPKIAHHGDEWSPEVIKIARKILEEKQGNSIDITAKQPGRGGLQVPLHPNTGNKEDIIENTKLLLQRYPPYGFEFNIKKTGSSPQIPLTVKNNNSTYNIDIFRALTDYAQLYKVNLEGTGLKRGRGRPRKGEHVYKPPRPKNPPRDKVKLHWSDKVMHGDNNYMLRNPFLNGRIAYYPFGANMQQITIRTPSAHALKIIRDMIETGTFDKADYDRLMKDEGDKMNRIIKQSNIVIPHDVELKGYHNEEVADLRQRYKILIGEITAGNKGKLVLDEMRDILRQLESYHAISAPTRAKLLKQIDAVDV